MSWDRILEPQVAPVRAECGRNAAVWVDIFRQGIEDGVRLGAEELTARFIKAFAQGSASRVRAS
jgi:hypothetical protein